LFHSGEVIKAPVPLVAKLELSEEQKPGELLTVLSCPLTWSSRFRTTEWVKPRVGRGCMISVKGWFEHSVKLAPSGCGHNMWPQAPASKSGKVID
jgi:hypothetical protein